MHSLLKKMGWCCCTLLSACSPLTQRATPPEQLLRMPYVSTVDGAAHDFFVYLPKGYGQDPERRWPVLVFLHGDGERGNGREDLDYVLAHGPLYEAWIQKKDLPFIILSPQLPMFGRDTLGISYLVNRDPASIPKRQADGAPPRGQDFPKNLPIRSLPDNADMSQVPSLLPMGWEQVETDVLTMIQTVQSTYKTDAQRLYLSGLSYGGFGTWYLASKHPDLFAAVAPVVAWGHPQWMAPIAQAKLPVWSFAGGRDEAISIVNFYAGMRALEAFGSSEVRFTVHEDMAHDTWKRVYAGEDLYQWLLAHKKEPR